MILYYATIAIFGIIGVLLSAFIFYFLALFLGFLFRPRNAKKEEEINEVIKKSVSKDDSSIDLTEDLELIAVITASICAYTGSSKNSFVVKSVQESSTPIWGMAERFRRFNI